jgi:hypothetical protein
VVFPHRKDPETAQNRRKIPEAVCVVASLCYHSHATEVGKDASPVAWEPRVEVGESVALTKRRVFGTLTEAMFANSYSHVMRRIARSIGRCGQVRQGTET